MGCVKNVGVISVHGAYEGKVAENFILKILEMGKPFIVTCDASRTQLGCVLS